MSNETETGFGSGLRAQIRRKHEPQADLVLEPEVAPEPDLFQSFTAEPEPVHEPEPEADFTRVELDAALAREQQLRDELEQQVSTDRDLAVRETELAQQTGRLDSLRAELEEQQLLARIQLDQVETERAELAAARSELVAEEARLTELASHVDERAHQLESADSEQAQASAHLAQQLAGIAERERELKRERAALDARREDTEVIIAARERSSRELDVAASERERLVAAREAAADGRAAELERERMRLRDETDAIETREQSLDRRLAARERMLENGETTLATREKRLREHGEHLERERVSHGQATQDAFVLLAELEQREERLRTSETTLFEREAKLSALAADVETRTIELRGREARLGADLDLREDAVEERERTVAEREEMIARRERDLAAYVRELQGSFNARSVA